MFPRITYNICMRSRTAQSLLQYRICAISVRVKRGLPSLTEYKTSRICQNSSMKSTTTPGDSYMSDPINDPLSHTGNEMLSGMSTKPSAVTDKDMKKFLKAGGKVQIIKPRKGRSHSLRTKSHQKGGVGSRYLSGGSRNQSGRSRRAA